MLLAIDVGNTNCTFAVLEGEILRGQWRLATEPHRTSDEYMLALSRLFELDGITHQSITGVILSTVVPQTLFPIQRFCQQYLECEPFVIGKDNVDIGIEVKIDRPEEVGADRLVNAVAASHFFGQNIIVVDFGTATTFDVIDKAEDYVGGIISPGINLSLDALKTAAAKLPEIAVEKPLRVIGKSTIEAMQSGIYWGYVSLIEGLVARIREECGCEMKTIATGGLAPLFFKATDAIEHLERDLTISGLRLIYEKNKH